MLLRQLVPRPDALDIVSIPSQNGYSFAARRIDDLQIIGKYCGDATG
jgi:hypothetical protein